VYLAGRWRKRRANFAKGVGLGAILGILAILIHGFTDFNLQIPANAVYFVGLCALALNLVVKAGKGEQGSGGSGAGAGGSAGNSRPAAARIQMDGRGEVAAMDGGPGERGSAGAGGGATQWIRPVIGAAVAIGLFVFAARQFLGFHYMGRYQDARAEARSVQSAFPELEGLLTKAVSFSGRPEIGKELGRLEVEMARAENEAGKSEERDQFCDRAVASYAAVIARSPIDSFAHYEMGMAYLLYNYPLMTYADKAKLFFRRALELNPADEFLNLNILFYYLTAWDGLGDEERESMAKQLKTIRSADPAFMPQLQERWKQQFGTTDALARILNGVGPQ
jgi:tetratricopeptide (TPR) repeat protein